VTATQDRAALYAAYLQACSAAGNSDPNPAVGAVITNARGKIVATGYTQRAGYAHAERHALSQLKQRQLGDHTLYVTLEPCCHHGRTPPCVDAIVERKLRRVIIAERDFAAEVQGRSVQLLRDHGIDVLEWNADDFRREKWFTTGPFFFARKHGRPRVLLKWAQTADGSLAPLRGKSGPISGATAALLTACWRFYCKLTVAPPGTVLIDAPRLTVRTPTDLPDLSHSGLSDFLWELLRRQYQLAREHPGTEALRQSVRPAQSLFLWPDTISGLLHGLPETQKVGSKEWRGKFIPLREWQDNFTATWNEVLSEILSEGFNSLLLEAGPAFSNLVIEHNYADAIAVYRSHTKRDAKLWGSKGRGNALSALLAHAEKPDLPGYTLIEFARLDTDDFLLFVRDDTW
jgi:diaminohydroxyphosphoribosylaminopyrimidine deaminase/5-amino-6-(5-phosphoribosylamino)uracil reductase